MSPAEIATHQPHLEPNPCIFHGSGSTQVEPILRSGLAGLKTSQCNYITGFWK